MVETALSVIVPTFNGAKFIERTLDSLHAQTSPLHEIIVVDDGSTDETVDLVMGHALRPKVIRQRNSGVAVARNRGALHASGRYIAFLDQDDLWHAERHHRLRAFFETGPQCEALITTAASFFLQADRPRLRALGEQLHRSADFPDVTDETALVRRPLDLEPGLRPTTPVTARDLLAGPPSVTTSYVFAREPFLAGGGCATIARSMDDYMALLSLSRTSPILLLDEPTILYRIHPSATTLTSNWPLPFLSSNLAARFGDSIVPLGSARDPAAVVPLSDPRSFFLHQLLQLVDGGSLRDLLDGAAVLQLTACGSADRRFAGIRMLKRWVRARAHMLPTTSR